MAEIEIPGGEVVAPNEEAAVEGQVEGESSEEEVQLPSDQVAFEMPEKFAGKSAEDIAKSYLELEKMKQKGGDEESQEEKPDAGDESSDKPTQLTPEEITTYEQSFRETGSLTDEQYAELEAKGISKKDVDDEIEYRQYKEEKAINKVIEPLGGGKEKLQEVVKWAGEAKTAEEVQAFNDALAAAPLVAQQAMLKGLYAEYDSADKAVDVLHTNAPQSTPTKGYANESEFFKDIGKPEYKTDKGYAAAVEAKLARSKTEDWSF